MMLRKIIFLTLLFLSTQTFAMNFDDINSFITDSAITTNIKTKLITDHTFSNSKITVHTDNGIVSVSGTADTLRNASLIIQTIASSIGVRDINTTQFKVMNVDQPLNDMIITAEIRGLFVRYQIFGASYVMSKLPISISTQQGVVTLTTDQATPKQIADAVAIAQLVRGVKEINTQEHNDSDT